MSEEDLILDTIHVFTQNDFDMPDLILNIQYK